MRHSIVVSMFILVIELFLALFKTILRITHKGLVCIDRTIIPSHSNWRSFPLVGVADANISI